MAHRRDTPSRDCALPWASTRSTRHNLSADWENIGPDTQRQTGVRCAERLRTAISQYRGRQVAPAGRKNLRRSQHEIDSCFVLENDHPITEDRKFRRLPRAAAIRVDVFHRHLGSIAGIEEKTAIVCRVQVSKGDWLKRRRREDEDCLSWNLAGEGLPVVGCAPARLDQIWPRFQFPPGIASEQTLRQSELSRAGKLSRYIPRGTAPGMAMRRKSVGLLPRVYLPNAVGSVGVSARPAQKADQNMKRCTSWRLASAMPS